MRIVRGMSVCTDYGELKIVCITKEWLVGTDSEGTEYALMHKDEPIWISIECEQALPPEDFVVTIQDHVDVHVSTFNDPRLRDPRKKK